MGDPHFEVIGDGRIPLVGHVPHCGVELPEDVRSELLLSDEELSAELMRITDHLTDRLFSSVARAGGVMFINRLSRLVVDPERFRDDSEEPMAARGAGAVYTVTSDLRLLRPDMDRDAQERLKRRYFDPYAKALEDLVGQVLERHGSCLILDCHSFPTEPLGYALDRSPDRPQLCIGTDSFHTPQSTVERLVEICRSAGSEVRVDSPYSGTYVPIKFYRRDPRVKAVMIEVRRDLYLEESSGEPSEGWEETFGLIEKMVQEVI